MKNIMKYLKPYGALMAAVMVMKLIGAVLELQIPSALADILDVAVPSGSIPMIVRFGLQMALFAVLEAIVNVSANVLSAKIANESVERIRQDLFERISHLSARQMGELTEASAVSRLTSDTFNVQQMFLRCLRMGIRAPALMLGGIFVTMTEDRVLTLVLLFSLPLVALLSITVTMKAVPRHRERQTMLDRMTRVVQENATGIRVIKALSREQHEKDRYDRANAELADKGMEAGFISAKSVFSTYVLRISLVCVTVLGAIRVNAGLMLPGKIVAFISYFTIITNATLSISNIFVLCSNGAASAQRIDSVIRIPVTMQTVEIPPEQSPYAVEFRNVSFSYMGVENNLQDISFALRKGQTLGIIGATGSGKTTLLNLLMRFYDAQSGQILLEGRDVRSIPNDELRKKFGVVFQNDFLVGDTIARNIDFYRDLGPEAAKKAAVLAQAAEFIAERDDGMEHVLAIKGNNISGGQKQRVLIARAVAAEPEILILDDSSSALDYRTDAQLRKALAENLADTTKVIVAQRVSSIQAADLILVLEEGRIIGRGTHGELMAACDEYRHIAEIQMEEAAGKEAAYV